MGDENSWFFSDSFQWDLGLKMKYLYASNDLSFTGIIIKTSGVEIVDKQSNYFHVWRLGNKMPPFFQEINSFKDTDVSGYLDRKENFNKTSSNRNFSSSLKPIIWLLISYFQTLRHSRSLSPSAKMWLNIFLTK